MRYLQDFLVYIAVRLFFGLLGALPLRVAFRVTEVIASVAASLTTRHRRIALRNLELAFPDSLPQWRREVFRFSYRRLGHLAVEISRLPRLNRKRVARRVGYEPGRGLENYRQAKAMGKGVLFVTAHISSWELLPAAHALLGEPLHFVVRPLDNPFLQRWSQRLRSQFGNATLAKKQVLRSVLKLLRKGEDVGFLLDQNVQEREAVFAPFFGHPAATSPAVASLAIRTGAPIVAGFIYPKGKTGNYRIRFYPPLLASPQDTALSLTTQINQRIEEMIRENPECWLWGHRRFHTQPDGSNLYRVLDEEDS